MSDDDQTVPPAAISQTFRDAFFVAAAAAATVGALDLILSSARSSSHSFLAAARHSDNCAATSLAQVAAGVTKILGTSVSDAPRPRAVMASQSNQSREARDTLPYGAPVVT